MLLLIGLLVFVGVGVGTYVALRPRPNLVRSRVLAGEPPPTTRERRMQPGLLSRVAAPGLRRLGQVTARLLPQNFVRRVNEMLIHANEPWSLTGFLSVWAAVVVLGIATLAYIATSSESITALQMTSIAALVVPMTVLAPYGLLRRRVRARQKAIVRALPDAMDLLVTSVEAGLGVDAAFAMVTEKTDGPLSDSFSLYLRQIGLGRSRQDALTHVAERTGVPDLISLATSVSQGEELGTTLGDVLRTQSNELRLARRQRAQEAAQRAPVLMTIPLALCFLPAMGAVIVVPSVMNLFNFVGNLGSG